MALCFYSCEESSHCVDKKSTEHEIRGYQFTFNNLYYDYGLINNNKERKMLFWFKYFPETQGQAPASARLSTICTSSEFKAAMVVIQKDNDPFFQLPQIKLVCFYPSVPPSGIILRSIGDYQVDPGNLGKRPVSNLSFSLPYSLNSIEESTWVEFGAEVEMKSVGDLEQDMKNIRDHLDGLKIGIEFYVY